MQYRVSGNTTAGDECKGFRLKLARDPPARNTIDSIVGRCTCIPQLAYHRDNAAVGVGECAGIERSFDNPPLSGHRIGDKLRVSNADKIDGDCLPGENNSGLRLDFVRQDHISIGVADLKPADAQAVPYPCRDKLLSRCVVATVGLVSIASTKQADLRPPA